LHTPSLAFTNAFIFRSQWLSQQRFQKDFLQVVLCFSIQPT
jgi:hypothetical protein